MSMLILLAVSIIASFLVFCLIAAAHSHTTAPVTDATGQDGKPDDASP